jgi:hypothetical protein
MGEGESKLVIPLPKLTQRQRIQFFLPRSARAGLDSERAAPRSRRTKVAPTCQNGLYVLVLDSLLPVGSYRYVRTYVG